MTTRLGYNQCTYIHIFSCRVLTTVLVQKPQIPEKISISYGGYIQYVLDALGGNNDPGLLFVLLVCFFPMRCINSIQMSQATALNANAIQHQSSTLTAVSIAGYYPLFSVSYKLSRSLKRHDYDLGLPHTVD